MTDVVGRLSRIADRETLPVVYATLRNMQRGQLLGMIDRTVRQAIVPSLPVDADRWYDRQVPSGFVVDPAPLRGNATTLRRCLGTTERRELRQLATDAAAGEVTLLNRTVDVGSGDGVDWFGPGVTEQSALWALQFHGFAFLDWATLGYDDPGDCPAVVETFADWLDDWYGSDNTRIGAPGYLRRGWTPHAVSLRILRLTRFCAWLRADTSAVTVAARIVARNAAFLANHVEHDVGGNHLVENGAALVAAGSLFENAGAEWRRQGVDVLADAGDQFLDDGGHFELSPMYHVITLTRYLTAVDLLRRGGHDVPTELADVAAAGTGFLRALSPPDGRIPLLNDAAFDEGLEIDACLRYADAVGVDADAGDSMAASGYYWLGTGDSRLLVDGGEIGPRHLPGHSHNDQFAVCFWADGRRVLTDTGVYEYAPGNRRQYARSVAAHNTVQYDDVEPIPLAGSYLLGRRFDPAVASGVTDGVAWFDGRYERAGRGPSYGHRRRIYHDEDWWLVWDAIDAAAAAPVTSRLHVAPELTVERPADAGQPRLRVGAADGDGDGRLAEIVPLGAAEATVATSQYFPRFGETITRPKIALRANGDAVRFGFLLSTETHDSVAVDRGGQFPAALSLDDAYRPLPDLG